MIITEFYDGQGLGNQIWSYVVLRALAEKNEYAFGVQRPDKFKGFDIFTIDFGKNVVGGTGPEGGPPLTLPESIVHYLTEEQLFEKKTSLNVTVADPRLLSIGDNTKFDGTLQSLIYLTGLEHLLPLWLKFNLSSLSKYEVGQNLCVIHVRGGYYLNTYSFLPKSYYLNAMNVVKQKNSKVRFVAVTDDLEYCNKILPDVTIIGSTPSNKIDDFKAEHHKGGSIAEDFFILNKAKFVILSSSTFSFWAVYLNQNNPFVVSPKYWFSFSTSNGWWSTAECVVPNWNYMDRNGKITDGYQCLLEAKEPISSTKIQKNLFHSLFFRLKRKISQLNC
jgi:hypothetical protein